MKFENWRAFPPFRRRRKRQRTTTAKTPTPNMSVVLHREAGGVVGVRVVRRRRCSGALQVRSSPQRVRAVGGHHTAQTGVSAEEEVRRRHLGAEKPRSGEAWRPAGRPDYSDLGCTLQRAPSAILPLDLPNLDTTSPETAPP